MYEFWFFIRVLKVYYNDLKQNFKEASFGLKEKSNVVHLVVRLKLKIKKKFEIN